MQSDNLIKISILLAAMSVALASYYFTESNKPSINDEEIDCCEIIFEEE